MPKLPALFVTALVMTATAVMAQDNLVAAKVSFIFNGERVRISQDNTEVARYVAAFSATQDGCGAPCIAPMQAAPGVATLDERQVLDFLVTEVAGNVGLMVDARMPQDRAKGFIPGTVNLPHGTVAPSNDFRSEILAALGARQFEGVFNFTDARRLLVYDNGPSSDDAGQLVRNLLEAGYPAELISYYRGGMQVWAVLGFSIEQEPA